MTRDQLLANVRDYLDRDDITDTGFLTWTQNAETEMWRTLRVTEMETSVADTLTDGASSLPVPTGFIEGRAIYVDGGSSRTTINYVSPEMLQDRFSSSNSTPDLYTHLGNELVLNGALPANTEYKIFYYTKLTGLGEDVNGQPNQSNAISVAYPDLYLYGVLAEAWFWAESYERSTLTARKFDNRVQRSNDFDRRKRHGTRLNARTRTANP